MAAETTKRGETPAYRGNPKDSMKSTWPTWDHSRWHLIHWITDSLNVYPFDVNKPVPVFAKTDKVPHLPQWSQQLWILAHAWPALAIHQAWLQVARQPLIPQYLSSVSPRLEDAWLFLSGPAENPSLHPLAILLIYFHVFTFTLVREIKILRRLGHLHGFLDGDVAPRDGIPDVGVVRIFLSLFKTIGGRLALFIFLCYNRSVAPIDALTDWKWYAWTFLEVGVYGVVLDFWFYLYHRAMHDVDGLWQFHRTHHLTKHPNPTLSAYADDTQEVFDMIIVPLLTYATMNSLGLKLGFYEWWICQQYIVYTEVWGHSGVRVHLTAASTLFWVLRIFDVELAVEDHDLHHRKGYRKSYNYGKQTRVWDSLFGTCHPRIESYDENIDYLNQARMPIF